MIFGFPRAKQGLCHYNIWGDPSLIRYSSKTTEQNIILWALQCSQYFFLVLYWNIFIFRHLRLLGISNLTISPLWSNYKSPLRTILNIFILLLEILQDLRYTLFVYEKLTFKSCNGLYGVQYYFSPTALRH